MIKNVIFDLGNVLLTFKPNQFLARLVEDEQRIESFTSKVILTETWLKLDRGTISAREARQRFTEKYPEEEEMLDLFFEHWMDMFEPITENVKVVRKLKDLGHELYVLSNFIREPCEVVNERHEFFQWFDGAVYSFEIHHLKPEAEMYQALLDRYGLIPEECVFLDDHQEFLDAAARLGMKTILVEESTDLMEELRNLGVFKEG